MRAVVAFVLAAVLVLARTGCATTTTGTGRVDALGMAVHGDSGDRFDTEAKTALADVIAFWQRTYPAIAHGRACRRCRAASTPSTAHGGGDAHVAGVGAVEQVPAQRLTFIVDNAAYCQLDDSIVWDRGAEPPARRARRAVRPTAHRAGLRPRVRARDPAPAATSTSATGRHTIDIESQADCAAGRVRRAALAGKARRTSASTPSELDRALDGLPPDPRLDARHPRRRLARQRLRPAQRAAADGIDHGRHVLLQPGLLHDRTLHRAPLRQRQQDYDDQRQRAAGGLDASADNGHRHRTSTGSGRAAGTTRQDVHAP